jgi:hypothetical protein
LSSDYLVSSLIFFRFQATCIHVSEDRERVMSIYPTEPVLQIAALNSLLREAPLILSQAICAFANADLGWTGECASQLLCLLSMQSITKATEVDMPLLCFFEKLFGASPNVVTQLDLFETGKRVKVLKSGEIGEFDIGKDAEDDDDDALSTAQDDLKDLRSNTNESAASSEASASAPSLLSSTECASSSAGARQASGFEAMFKDHFHLDDHDVVSMRLFHFVRVSKLVRESDLAAFYTLGAGIVMDRGHAAVDLVIPIKIKRQRPPTEQFSAVLIQVKNHARRISPNLALKLLQNMSLLRMVSSNSMSDDQHLKKLEKWRIHCLSGQSVDVLPMEMHILGKPVIKILMTLRDSDPQQSAVYRTGDAIQCILRGFPASLGSDIVKPLQLLVEDRADFAAKISVPWEFHCAQLLKQPHLQPMQAFRFESSDIMHMPEAVRPEVGLTTAQNIVAVLHERHAYFLRNRARPAEAAAISSSKSSST